jgi:hypothetical protein
LFTVVEADTDERPHREKKGAENEKGREKGREKRRKEKIQLDSNCKKTKELNGHFDPTLPLFLKRWAFQ